MSKLMRDAALQRRMLLAMNEDLLEGVWMEEFDGLSERTIMENLSYLEQHGLCESGIAHDMSGPLLAECSRITAAGQDYLSEDGGLTHELRTMTVRIHPDTVKILLGKQIDESDLPEEKKDRLRKHLSELPDKALQAVVSAGLEGLLGQVPGLLDALRTSIGL